MILAIIYVFRHIMLMLNAVPAGLDLFHKSETKME